MPAVPLVASYEPPAGDRAGDRVRGRSWTYDCAVTATALAAAGDLDGAGAILGSLGDLQRPDGALDGSYDLAGRDPAGPLRSGNQAWVGLAALEWRAATGSRRHDRLLVGVARWLLAHRAGDRGSPGFGLVRGGPDVSWISTEHNLEARAFFAGLLAVLVGRAARRSTGCPRLPPASWPAALPRRSRASTTRSTPRCSSPTAPTSVRASATTPGRSTCRPSASSG